ncbi:amino acid adenylation domain-containing protein [Sinanaerobacter sp. ZZT-01]|uniref:amino acid adenylation domain-containing protein n=1 Tax=Sinanaerobacter sp. ZZT-01 TaxID=3111540 RepID=UPI002D77C70A|nr:amino acid adenylation domain-containing protein [Sinanaerobacter sp. ZZT-01]WRR94937.1 amino acid adenylation domain-containing protein [Sinanaerobacter sp. ZZT-01]
MKRAIHLNAETNVLSKEQMKTQAFVRESVNQTDKEIVASCIHEGFFKSVKQTPDLTAVVWLEKGKKRTLTYQQLYSEVMKTAALLKARGIKSDSNVLITLPKGYEQIIAVLSVLALGCTYVPVNVSHPQKRVERITQATGAVHVLTNKEYVNTRQLPFGLLPVMIEERTQYDEMLSPLFPDPQAAAYIIFTSGSTGEPKGVVISHDAANNTIVDINEKMNIGRRDCIFAISELDFDLSVYDVFAPLSVGGCAALISEEEKKEPASWMEIVKALEVTVWNSVPMLFNMLLTVCESVGEKLPLKIVMLSGDWVPLNLYDRLKKIADSCRLIALGGATEAAIWSNYYEVLGICEEWRSIPYGKPLSNQKMRVVDKNGLDCPDYVSGELWIGGRGVAKGYIQQEELTQERFCSVDGVRWYRTGDRALYWEDGTVEFLGRLDNQVKLRGYRIELGEIESVCKLEKMIEDAAAVVIESNRSSQLALAVTAKKNQNRQAHCVLQKDKTKWKDEKLNERKNLIEAYLLHLCSFDNLVINSEKRWVSKQAQPLFDFWCRWLQRQDIVKIEDGIITAGNRYREVDVSRCRKTTPLQAVLNQSVETYRKILSGEDAANVILQMEELSPEALSMQGSHIRSCIDQIASIIKQHSGGGVKIAVLGARTGLAAKYLYDKLEGIACELTLFDDSAGLLHQAEKRWDESCTVVRYASTSNGMLASEHVHTYDFAVSVNALHRYVNPQSGLDYAYSLLKKQGCLLAVELEELDPVALISSAVLENGFQRFACMRKRADTPLLDKEEWQQIFLKSQFEHTKITVSADDGVLFIEAKRGKEKEFTLMQLQEELCNYLPQYMIPDTICLFLQFPLNDNGKIDRRKIVDTISATAQQDVADTVYSRMEERIAAIWHELLGCGAVGRQQGFFEIGGDSLSATKFISLLKEDVGINFSLREIFDNPFLQSIAALAEKKLDHLEPVVEGEL